MQAPCETPAKPVQLTLFVWESEVVTRGPGRVEIVAKRPLSHMSCKQAARVLGVSEWTVSDLFRLGLLQGYKPGARMQRKDGKASNAALRLDSESVLRYKQEREAMSRMEA
jgi:transposase